MLGVILCGGQSVRMGTDKGLIKTDLVNWAQQAVEKMGGLDLPVLISVNNEQFDSYTTFFAAGQLVKDDTNLDVRGPLLGLLSIHIQYPAEDLFVLACDMPLMETSILQQLYSQYEKQKAGAYIFTNDGVPEPLCAIYTATALSKLLHLLNTKQLLRHSMKYALEQVYTFSVAITDHQKQYFRNVNSHAALNGL